jgi:G-protein signaling modulator 2
MELTPEHLSKLDEMVTLLLLSDDLTIAFVRCNEPVLRDALYTTMKERIGNDVFIYDIKMSEHDTNLLQLLNNTMESEFYKEKREDNKKIAFFVFGLDEAINKQKTHGISEALVLLNMMREDFLRINHAIIIWINSASLSAILKEAPDFFSWRTTVFEFDIKRKELARSMTEFGETDLIFLNKQELEERWEYYIELLQSYQEKGIDDAHKFANWNYNLGMIKLLTGYPAEALNYFEKSLEFSEKLADRAGIASALGNLGNAYSHLGDVKQAIKYYEQALVIAKEIGDRRGEGNRLGNLGSAYSDLGDVKQAIEYYEQALAIGKQIKDQRIITFCEKALANIM